MSTLPHDEQQQQEQEQEAEGQEDEANIDCEIRAFTAAAGVSVFAACASALQTSVMKVADKSIEMHGPDDPIVLACSDIEVYLNNLKSQTTNLTNDANLRALVAAKSAASKTARVVASAAQRYKQQYGQICRDQQQEPHDQNGGARNSMNSSCAAAYSAAADMVLTATTAASRALNELDVESTWVTHRSNVAQANELALLRRQQILLETPDSASDNNSAPFRFASPRTRSSSTRTQPQKQATRCAECLKPAWHTIKHAWVRVFVAFAYCRCCRCH